MPKIKRDWKATRLCGKCTASLCPREPDLSYIWLQGDLVCASIKFNQRAKWVKVQDRINKLPHPVDGFFTIGSLSRIKKVRLGVKGKCPKRYRSHKFSTEQRTLLEAIRGCGEEADLLLEAAAVKRRP